MDEVGEEEAAHAFEKERSAGYLANHLARLFAHRLARALAPHGLAPAQFMALLELWREEGLTQADLVTRLDVEQATLAATLARMVRDGLVTSEPHAHDRRARALRLTERARALEAPAKEAAAAVNREALAALAPQERALLVALMGKLVAGMRA